MLYLMITLRIMFPIVHFALGTYLFWTAYRIGIRGRLDLIRGWGTWKIKNPDKLKVQFVLLHISGAIALFAVPVYVAINRLPFGEWHFVSGFVGCSYALALQLISWRHLERTK
jgi:hypothetical protein